MPGLQVLSNNGVENREFQFGGDGTTGYVQRVGPYMDCWQHSFFLYHPIIGHRLYRETRKTEVIQPKSGKQKVRRSFLTLMNFKIKSLEEVHEEHNSMEEEEKLMEHSSRKLFLCT